MIAPDGAPEWAKELCTSFESGASGQFVLYGNVHDRRLVDGELVNVEDYVRDELLGDIASVLRALRADLRIESRLDEQGRIVLAPLPKPWVGRRLERSMWATLLVDSAARAARQVRSRHWNAIVRT